MAKKAGSGMSHNKNRKTRGRTAISGHVGDSYMGKGDAGPRPTRPNVPEVVRAEANRPVSSGGKHRGDRRDTSKSYTGNARHPSRGNNPRIDVKTRAR
jgi:hypothetical protein